MHLEPPSSTFGKRLSETSIDLDRHVSLDGDSRIGALPIRDTIPPTDFSNRLEEATKRQLVAASESPILNHPISMPEKPDAISGRQQRRAGKCLWFSEAWIADSPEDSRFFPACAAFSDWVSGVTGLWVPVVSAARL
jgi:hypothetical protein